MFKKFKDKLAEEMKQSPSRLQAGMQQLAQAVSSPVVATSIDDPNPPAEGAGEFADDFYSSASTRVSGMFDSRTSDTARNESAAARFQSVDLLASDSTGRSRRSSFGSVTSENFFPSYESPGNLSRMQSDVEQSASELEDGSSQSRQLEQATKDELYAGYQKLRAKYSRYRAAYRELCKENAKMKSVLVETQDKALRRIANLKEQCQLEQEAKAHLEEALRNDIEEKDHAINALATKIKLLLAEGPDAGAGANLGTAAGNGTREPTPAALDADADADDDTASVNSALKEKVRRLEALLAKCNESLKRNKERIIRLTEERDILERDFDALRTSVAERTETLESELYKARREISSLNEQIGVCVKREEDSALSLAENKLSIHRELEVKEEQNKRLRRALEETTAHKDSLAEAVARYDRELRRFQALPNDRDVDDDEGTSRLRDTRADTSDTVRLVPRDARFKLPGARGEAPDRGVAGDEETGGSRDELEMKNAQLLGLSTELKSCKCTINDLKEMLREATMDREQARREKERLIANMSEYGEVLRTLRRDCDSVRSEVNDHCSAGAAALGSMNEKLARLRDPAIVVGGGEEAANGANGANGRGDGESREPDSDDPSPSGAEDSSVELKTVINENNALRKRCERLTEQNERMAARMNETDVANGTIVKLMAEIDELNLRLRDVAELHEAQRELHSDMEELKGRWPFGAETADSDARFADQISSLKEKLAGLDTLGRDNASLNRELVESRTKLAAALGDAEALRLERSRARQAESGIGELAEKCAGHEKRIAGLTGRLADQSRRLESLREESAVRKAKLGELSEKCEARDSRSRDTAVAIAEQARQLEALDENHRARCSEIDALRRKEAEIRQRLGDSVGVREAATVRLNELEARWNDIVEKREGRSEELRMTNERLSTDLEALEKLYSESVASRTNDIEILTRDKARMAEETERSRARMSEEIDALRSDIAALRLESERLRADNAAAAAENDGLREERENARKLNAELDAALEDLRREKDRLEVELLNSENRHELLRERLDAERSDTERRVSELNEEAGVARAAARAAENESAELRGTIDRLRAETETAGNRGLENEPSGDADGLRDDNKELRARLDEAVVLREAKESQMEILNQELRRQAEMHAEKLRTNEEEQSMRIKQLVKEFQAQIHDKDEQIQAALEKRFERQQNYESDLIQRYKEQLKDFQIELTSKSEQIESLILDNKETARAYKDEIGELTRTIAGAAEGHATELENLEQSWKTVLRQRTEQLEAKHTDEVNELTKEWSNERRTGENDDDSRTELEGTSRVAVATIQSNTGSLHSLQQTMMSQRRELAELRKLLRIRNESLEASTEIEYLRNILFEYMMGRETLVLTRVISAVVKFDQEQTSKVLKREEDKLTLLGSLGLS